MGCKKNSYQRLKEKHEIIVKELRADIDVLLDPKHKDYQNTVMRYKFKKALDWALWFGSLEHDYIFDGKSIKTKDTNGKTS